MNEDLSVNKKILVSLALSLMVLVSAISPAAAAPSQRTPNRQERRQAASRRPAKRRKSAQAQEITYTCPMHHDVHLKSPGECPKCGMELDAEKPGKAKSE
jgi:Heavy metal binding domain